MGYSTARAAYEAALARAHIAVTRAETCAEELNSPGAAFDCHMIALELTRLADDSLTGNRRKLRADQAARSSRVEQDSRTT